MITAARAGLHYKICLTSSRPLNIPVPPVPTLVSALHDQTQTSVNMPSELETAMESLIKVFHKYASKEGRSGTLSRRELRELMENELSNFLQSQKDPAAIDKIMKDLDTNGDGQVDFEEFVSLVVGLSIACEQCYQMHMKKTCKK
ncbi:protein S100-A10a [Halichoeres trimaculatus]|uniref:protein S100-A10a n=1 Tax=Halichoeres trimaculatus TaxID=147232 RepID=UPI003D9E5AC2